MLKNLTRPIAFPATYRLIAEAEQNVSIPRGSPVSLTAECSRKASRIPEIKMLAEIFALKLTGSDLCTQRARKRKGLQRE